MLRYGCLLLVAGNLCAQSAGISMRMETATRETRFRIGEAIPIDLTFESETPTDWMVSINGQDRSVLGLQQDRFPVTPAEGTSDPLAYRIGQPMVYVGPGGMTLREKTMVAHVDLNQWVRFERPGFYRVHALFHARSGSLDRNVALESNDVGIEITARDAEWQARQLLEDVDVLNASPVKPDSETFERRTNAARRIWYLDTPDSIREAGRLLGTMDVGVNQILQAGLQASGRRDVAVAAMKQLMQSSDQPVTPAFLDTLAELEALQSTMGPPDRYQARADMLQQLRGELAAVAERKRDRAKAISLKTVIESMPPDSAPTRLREETAEFFSWLSAPQQSELLGGQWQKIAGPEMIPVLRKIYDSAPDAPGPPAPLVGSAVERLYELDPVQGREVILDEIRRPVPRLPYPVLAMLPDAALPGMDSVLLENLQRNMGSMELISRYATAGIITPVTELLAKRNLPCDVPLLAWLLRVDEERGKTAWHDESARCGIDVTSRTGAYYSGPAWEEVAVASLQSPSVAIKSDAVKALGQYGSAASKQAVWAAFRYWHDYWKDKPAEMTEQNFERTFLEALARGKNWSTGSEDLDKLRDLCITRDCRAQAEEYRRQLK